MKRLTIRARTWFVVMLAVLVLVQLAPTSGVAAADSVEKVPVVLFPFAVGSGVEFGSAEYAAQYAGDLLVLLEDGLTAGKCFSVVRFDARSACVKRAVQEQKLTAAEITEPIDTSFFGVSRAQKLAGILGVRYAMIGSIDRYDFQEAKGEAELTVTVQLIDVGSGKVKNAFTATGRAARSADQGEQTELATGIAAAYDAAEKLLSDIQALSAAELAALRATADGEGWQPSGRKKSKGLIPFMLGAALIGFLLSGG